MIKLSVYYPDTPGKRFDVDYYCGTHMNLVKAKCGSALKRAEVERGVAGFDPGSPAPYRVVGHLTFDSLESFQGSFGKHVQEIVGDLPNFTDIQPTVQISEIVSGA